MENVSNGYEKGSESCETECESGGTEDSRDSNIEPDEPFYDMQLNQLPKSQIWQK